MAAGPPPATSRQWPLTRATDWAPPQGRHIQVPAGGCFVREAGHDQPTIVLLHGLPDDSRIYGSLQPRLAAAHRTVAPDFFGWGSSLPNEGLSLGFDMLDRTLTQVLDALELTRVVLVAHDMSGPAAIRWTAMHPDRAHALVLLNTYYGWNSARMPFALKLLHLPYVGRLVRRFLDVGRTGLSWHVYRWQVGQVWPGWTADFDRLLRDVSRCIPSLADSPPSLPHHQQRDRGPDSSQSAQAWRR